MKPWLETLEGESVLVLGGGDGLPRLFAGRFRRVYAVRPGGSELASTAPPQLQDGELIYLPSDTVAPSRISEPVSLIVLAFTLDGRDDPIPWLESWLPLLDHQARIVLLEWHTLVSEFDEEQALHRELLDTLELNGRLRRPAARDMMRHLQSAGLVHLRQTTVSQPRWFSEADRALLVAEGLRDLAALGMDDSELAQQLRAARLLNPGPVRIVHGMWKSLPQPTVDEEETATVEDAITRTRNGASPPTVERGLGTIPELIATVLAGRVNDPPAVAQRLLRAFGARALTQLADATLLATESGLSEDDAEFLLAVIQLGRQLHSPGLEVEIHGPEDAWRYLAPEMARLTREHFRGLYLNVKGRIVVDEVISIGTLTSALVHPREVFGPAIEQHCHSVLIAHNHPSGDPTPSLEDIHLTRELAEAGRLLNIELLDHIVIGRDGYVSLKEKRHF